MMEFDRFNRLLQAHVATIFKSQSTLFVADVDKDKLWNLYLDSFPAGTNQIFRQRRESDCSCRRNFIRSFADGATSRLKVLQEVGFGQIVVIKIG